MNYDPQEPSKDNRDRFILSKGHAGAGVYAALSESGFFPSELLKQHYSDGSIFSGHVSHKGVPVLSSLQVHWDMAFQLHAVWLWQQKSITKIIE